MTENGGNRATAEGRSRFARALEAALNGARPARLQFHVCEPFEGGRNAEIANCGFSDRRLDLAAHRIQFQLL